MNDSLYNKIFESNKLIEKNFIDLQTLTCTSRIISLKQSINVLIDYNQKLKNEFMKIVDKNKLEKEVFNLELDIQDELKKKNPDYNIIHNLRYKKKVKQDRIDFFSTKYNKIK